MARDADKHIENVTNGFLSEVADIKSHIANAVAVTARYDERLYDDTLFEVLKVPCPRNIAAAVRSRKADYLAGRAVAVLAMRRLGHANAGVTTAPSRAPIWPEGLAGSLSHARGRCACLLSRNTAVGYGIDTEAVATGTSLQAILSETLTARDRQWVAQSALPTSTAATLAFSAKEALFKALYPQVGQYFGFDAAELSGPPEGTGLSLALTTALTPHLKTGQSFGLHPCLSDPHVPTWLAAPVPGSFAQT